MAASSLPSIPNVTTEVTTDIGHLSVPYYDYLRKLGVIVEQLIVTQGREFYSIADLEAATLSTSDATVRLTLAIQGSAILRRAASAPSHAAYVESNDGGFYVFESGCLFPELCGAVADDATDNTDTLIAWATAFSTLNPQFAAFQKDGVYRLLNEAQATTHNSAATVTVANCSFFAIAFNGATLRTTFTGSLAPECIRFDNCQNFTVTDFIGLQDKSQGAPTFTYGTRWVQFVKGCKNFSFVGYELTRGLSGLTCTRAAGSSDARCSYGHIQGKSTDVYYNKQDQWSGDNCTFDVETVGAGRSWIFYNIKDTRGRIKSTPANVIVGDIQIGSNGHNLDEAITSGIGLHYTSISNAQAGACPIVFALGQTEENNVSKTNYATALQDIEIDLNIAQNHAFGFIVSTRVLKFDGGGNLIDGDIAGYAMTNIRISGTVNNDCGTTFMSLGEAANGFTINTTLAFSIRDLIALEMTKAINLGQYAAALIDNLNMPNALITRAGGYDERYLTIVHSRSSGVGAGLWYSKFATLV